MKWLLILGVSCTLGCSLGDAPNDAQSDSITAAQLAAQPKPKPTEPTPIVLTNDKKRKKYRVDEYWLQKIGIKGDILNMSVTTGGGCEEHVYTLVGGKTFMESVPVQSSLLLAHDANNDTCEAIVGSNLKFDLTPLKKAYLAAYPKDTNGVIRLVIYGPNPKTPLKRVDYTF